jgi:outer membrane biosynthesis protein TonB
VDLRRIIGSGITASAIVHLSFLVLVTLFSEVRPFGSVTAEPIAVDIVAPDEVKSDPSPASKSEDSNPFDAPGKAADSSAASAASPPPAASPSPAAAPSPLPQQALADPSPPAPSVEQKAAVPVPSLPAQSPLPAPEAESIPPQPQPAVQPPVPPPASQQAYVPAQPDLTIKYHVMLGLPQDKPGDGFDAVASEKADVASGPIDEFRRHLKSCSTLPKSISPSDKVAIKLRVLMTPDGRLAAPPMLVEASASAKGPALMQSAMSALQACQPYSMLPADKYREWKVLDLNFTPQDFTSAS